MPDLPFSRKHKARFQELLAIGELQAANNSKRNFELGPWAVCCDLTNVDIARRLEARFRAAVQQAAIAAGAPYRINRVDWWIGKLTHGRALGLMQDLIRRSAEYCEELETRAIELGRTSAKPRGVGGLYRDRYPCIWGTPCFLYDEAAPAFSDSTSEFEWWNTHIWSGFNGAIEEHYRIDGPRKRQVKETRKEFRDRIMRRVDSDYAWMKRSIQGLSYPSVPTLMRQFSRS
jgi:hypothetical protein